MTNTRTLPRQSTQRGLAPRTLALFLAAMALVLLLAGRQVWRATTTPVWVARTSLPAGSRIGPQALVQRRLASSDVLPGTLSAPAAVLGQTTIRPKNAGQPFVAADFRPPAQRQWLSEAPPAGRVVTSIRVAASLLPTMALRQGDRFDLIAVSRRGVARVVARDAWLLGSMVPTQAPARPSPLAALTKPPSLRGAQRAGTGSAVTFVFAARPQDVVPMAQAEGEGDRITLALHGRRDVEMGTSPAIGSASPTSGVEVIAGARRERVGVGG